MILVTIFEFSHKDNESNFPLALFFVQLSLFLLSRQIRTSMFLFFFDLLLNWFLVKYIHSFGVGLFLAFFWSSGYTRNRLLFLLKDFMLDSPREPSDHHEMRAAAGWRRHKAVQRRRRLHPKHYGCECAEPQNIHHGCQT